MHRFYIPNPNIENGILDIKESDIVYQASKVLRMHVGSELSIFNDAQQEFKAEISNMDRHIVSVKIIDEIKRDTEPKLKIHLYQAIPKKTALLELVIQKATEIGVSHIHPMITKRTEKRQLGKFERLKTIAKEAAEQSRRLSVPVIHKPIEFKETIKGVKNTYIAYENEKSKMLNELLQGIDNAGEAHILIGPEGGFDNEEIDFATKNNAKLFGLGSRILRTETASIASLSLILLRG